MSVRRMLTIMVLALVVAWGGAVAPGHAQSAPSMSTGAATPTLDASLLERLYAEGQRFDEFLAAVSARRAQWVANYEQGRVAEEAVASLAAIGGAWRLLVVAVDACSDSVSTLPYLARLAERVPTLDLRIVGPEMGQPIIEARRSPDGRATTPTIIVLDADGRDRGCWIEQPAGVQSWWLAAPPAEQRALFSKKMAWYEQDGGSSTVREIVEVIEAAVSGSVRCGR